MTTDTPPVQEQTGPFWRPQAPLNEGERMLVSLLLNAHLQCSLRSSCSTQAFAHASAGSRNFANGVIAALSSMGGPHAPFQDAYEVLTGTRFMVPTVKTPGWGNSFVKGQADPAWVYVDAQLRNINPGISEKIDSITAALHKKRKMVFPNAACYTAAVCITVALPIELAPMFFIQGRIEGYAHLFNENVLKGTE